MKYCTVCLREIPVDRTVETCGQRCRGLDRAAAKARARGEAAKVATLASAAGELRSAVATASGFADVDDMKAARRALHREAAREIVLRSRTGEFAVDGSDVLQMTPEDRSLYRQHCKGARQHSAR